MNLMKTLNLKSMQHKLKIIVYTNINGQAFKMKTTVLYVETLVIVDEALTTKSEMDICIYL